MRKILIIEPDTEYQILFEKALDDILEEGGELFFAHTKEEGFQVMKEAHPHLVFLPYALYQSKEWAKGPYVVVICNAGEEPKEKVDYLCKPFKARQILEKSRQVLGADYSPSSALPPPM